MKSIPFLQFNKPFVYGVLLMAMPTLFFFAVFCEQFLSYPALIENIFVRIDQVSPVISILMMIGFPLVAALINGIWLWKHFQLTHSIHENDFGNLLLLLYSIMTIAVIFMYSISENMHHTIH